MAAGTPVLWQIKISHYNEKARWALDYKGVAHRRRAPMPLFATLPIAWLLTRGKTFPILRLDGWSIADSTRIIGTLEERYPRPPLYPADPVELERALALEEYFDEQLAPHVRRVVWQETMQDPRAFLATSLPDSGSIVRGGLRVTAPLAAPAVRRRYGATAENAREARERIVAAMRRLESEIGSSGYLVGDTFSVADLTAASLLTPILLPPEHPYPPAVDFPESLRRFRGELEQMPGASWVFEIYRRHRGASAEIGADQPRGEAHDSPRSGAR
jgi:glutathione S-transferase